MLKLEDHCLEYSFLYNQYHERSNIYKYDDLSF